MVNEWKHRKTVTESADIYWSFTKTFAINSVKLYIEVYKLFFKARPFKVSVKDLGHLIQ